MQRGGIDPSLKYRYRVMDIDFIINECLADIPIITQSRICEEYAKRFDGSNLLEDLANMNVQLTSLVQHSLSRTIRVVPDDVEPIFIRHKHIDQSLAPLPSKSSAPLGIDVGKPLKAIESVPIITEAGPSPTHSVVNLTAVDGDCFNVAFEHDEILQTLSTDFGAVELIDSAEEPPTVPAGHHLPQLHDEPVFFDVRDNVPPPPPGFESVVPPSRQRAIPLPSPPSTKVLDVEQPTDIDVVSNGFEELIVIATVNSETESEMIPVKAVKEAAVEKPALIDLTEFLETTEEVSQPDVSTESKVDSSNPASATTKLAPSIGADHFYDSDFDSEPADENIIEPYWIVDGCVVNYAKARTQRDEVIAKIRSELFTSSTADTWAEKIIDLSAVFALLRRLYDLHPSGCTAQQLCRFEETLFAEGTHFTTATSVPSTAALLGVGLLYVDRDGLFHVASDVPKIRPQMLQRNFTSNLYRILHTHDGQLPMRELVPMLPLLVPRFVNLNAESVVRICNRIPLIFRLECRAEDHYSLENAYVCLTRAVPEWMVQFDCEYSDVDGMLCDCKKCCPKCTYRDDDSSSSVSSRPSAGRR